MVEALDDDGQSVTVQIPEPSAVWGEELARYYRTLVTPGTPCDYLVMQGFPPTAWWEDPVASSNGARVVWRATFETDRLPPDWVERANSAFAVWVPSHFNVGRFVESGVQPEKLIRLPPPVYPTRRRDAGHGGREREDRKFRFLSVFTWQMRKGWDVLLKAFLLEFSTKDAVELTMKVGPFRGNWRQIGADISQAIDDCGRSRPQLPNIQVIGHTLDGSAMSTLYRSADAFVLPTRGEGWGLPLFDAMAFGLPTVATGWGGHTDYMMEGNSYLIDYDILPVDRRGVAEWSLFAGHRWAEPSVDHLRAILRVVYESGSDVRTRAECGYEHVQTSYGTARFVNSFRKLIGG